VRDLQVELEDLMTAMIVELEVEGHLRLVVMQFLAPLVMVVMVFSRL